LRDTGTDTNTGGRIFQLRDIIGKSTFFCTYGDGLADIDIQKLLQFHRKMGRIATVTCSKPMSRFGSLDLDDSGLVSRFAEKPIGDVFVNAGFFVFEPEIFDYLDDKSVLETKPLETLADEGQLAAFKHFGFWKPMDTYRETLELNQLWDRNQAKWRIW
jgi:glucose-1-phosphate cytidylyltransferase